MRMQVLRMLFLLLYRRNIRPLFAIFVPVERTGPDIRFLCLYNGCNYEIVQLLLCHMGSPNSVEISFLSVSGNRSQEEEKESEKENER